MNKGAKRRAFFVTLFVGVIYLCVFMKGQDRIGVGRTTAAEVPSARSAAGLSHGPAAGPESTIGNPGNDDDSGDAGPVPVAAQEKESSPGEGHRPDEPSFFVAVPIVVHALRQGWIEKDGLIPVSDGEKCQTRWRKAEEILLDKDEKGLKRIGAAIGRKRLVEVLEQEGVSVGKDATAEEIINGRGYSMDKEKLIAFFTRYVTSDYDRLFPYTVREKTIVRGSSGFQFVQSRRAGQVKGEKDVHEWTVPDVVNMPIRAAIEKMGAHTAQVKVYGSGTVTDQRPRASEKVKGEGEVVLFGRAQKR